MPVTLPVDYKLPGRRGAVVPTAGYFTAFTSTTTTSTWAMVAGYVVAVILTLLAILLLINYTVTPIFQLYPGGPGYIPVPGGDNGQLLWPQGSTTPAPIKNTDTKVATITSNWSFALDIMITNPISNTTSPRVIFYRGDQPPSSTSDSHTLAGLLLGYNVAIALVPDTTDLLVSVMNSSKNMENIVLSNAPVQTPFRIGVIIMDTAMEVYFNGRLFKTRTFDAPPSTNKGTNFYPPQGTDAGMFKVANLHIWNSVITASQMRYATPTLMTVKTSQKSDIPSSSCINEIEKDADQYEQEAQQEVNQEKGQV